MGHFLSQSWLLDRRHVLRALGTCIPLPFLECMVPLQARPSQQQATPKRSAFIYLANGVHSLNYQITTPGRDYQFSRSLKPLEKHRDVITPISGLHHPGALSHHHNCISVWLTGGRLGPSDRNSISVDQKIAEVTAKHTRYPSLEVALTGDSLSWTTDGVRLPSLRRCSEIFATLFEAPKGGTAAYRRTLRRKGSVLDANLAEVRQLEQAMGAGDKGRLDQYLTSVREAEIRTRRADAWLDANPPGARRAAMVVDGYAELDGRRRDALIARVIAYGPPVRSLFVVVPYRPRAHPGGFAVHAPRFGAFVGVDAPALPGLGAAFFHGLASHLAAATIWRDHLEDGG